MDSEIDEMFSLLAAFAIPDGVGAMPTFVSAFLPSVSLRFTTAFRLILRIPRMSTHPSTELTGSNSFLSPLFLRESAWISSFSGLPYDLSSCSLSIRIFFFSTPLLSLRHPLVRRDFWGTLYNGGPKGGHLWGVSCHYHFFMIYSILAYFITFVFVVMLFIWF